MVVTMQGEDEKVKEKVQGKNMKLFVWTKGFIRGRLKNNLS